MILNLIKKAWKRKSILRSLPYSIYINFSKLPLAQAVKLPILLYKPQILTNSGRIVIEGPVRFGMVRLGFSQVPLFPNSGFMLENRGTITFRGRATIGNASAVSIGPDGHLSLGDEFMASTSLKLVCYHNVTMGDRVRFGWNSMVVDTDFHSLSYVGGGHAKGYGDITIGDDCWIANGCKIYKNINLPDHCIVGSDTVLLKGIADWKPYSLICNDKHVEIKATGLYRDIHNDKIVADDAMPLSPTGTDS